MTKEEQEQLSCEKCGSTDLITQVGTASGRKTHQCKACGAEWREKNAAAAALGRLRMNGLTPEQRSEMAKDAAEKRWQDERLKQNVKPLKPSAK